ncbi:MAG: Excinuclease ABC, C subunit domain protein [Berkelbacteria bacterium GW2011_GWB1_38_5]|uniref:Excinuclease ABC, C subunit domain protein n=2 Tax=Candidatus Berkelbacteria TaxID=1618330 RepID=A0A0G0FJF1_9BACT|nr:MAG: Excinuclease ABC, C subunit domain protein [Berkelbacteria bacterium GW2011_GWA1_36_9]KKQ74198.1 MAG: Excinuclease ABC, C subunit domain protein [Berkelbacteria bacterium GW2011_GWB1_38_5]
MDNTKLISKIKKFPEVPGIYIMRDEKQTPLYIGKASSLRHRVLSYFQRPQETRLEKMLEQVKVIEIQKTDSVIEALFSESNLIKKYKPKYNIKLKDDKTFLGIFITKEDWPRVMPARLTQKLPEGEFFGPFPSSGQVREALQILRKIFPFRASCKPMSGKACFEYHLGMCPGVCAGKVDQKDYQRTVKQIRLFLQGHKKEVIRDVEKQMKELAKNLEFEKAAKLRDTVFALRHIQDVALIAEDDLKHPEDVPERIEAYDISNISGAFAVGSMVVFSEGLIDKAQYRKFKIKTVSGANDIAMLSEIFRRRFEHSEWPNPNLILVDGGKGQVNGAKEVLKDKKLEIPVVGIAKGPKRDKDEIIADEKLSVDKKLLLRIRDEAHRFAISYYRLRHQKSLK